MERYKRNKNRSFQNVNISTFILNYIIQKQNYLIDCIKYVIVYCIQKILFNADTKINANNVTTK